MLKCLLLDDELPGLAYLKMLCEQVPDLEVVKAFNDPEVFLKESASLDFDFCIMDIQMPKMTGLQVASVLRSKPIIFATAYHEFAAEAYDLDVIDYVRKPIRQDRLQSAINKVVSRLHHQNVQEQSFTVNTDKGKAIVHFKDLLYISTSTIDARDKEAFLSDGTKLLFKNINFEKLQQLLPSTEFVRVNKRQLLSKKIVKSYTSAGIISTLLDERDQAISFNLSDSYRDSVLNTLQS